VDHNEETGRYNIGVTALVRVRLRDGTSHEDVGYGKLENTKSKADGLDKVRSSVLASV
jgi:DNA repair and recombination protein RAD52